MTRPLKEKPPQWHALTTEANVAEIHRQLHQGVRPAVLARKVQASDPPLFPGRTARQVSHWFVHYRHRVIQPEWTRGMLGAARSSRGGRLVHRLDVIAELETLAMKLGARFDRFFGEENGPAIGAGALPARPLPGLDLVAKNYRTTLVELAWLCLETGLMYRVPQKIESALVTAMAGRSVFEFTDEDVARFNRACLIEGMTPEVIEQARGEDALGDGRRDDGRVGDDPGGDGPGSDGPRGDDDPGDRDA